MFFVSLFSKQLVTLLFLAQEQPQPDSAANSFQELGSLFLWGMLGAIGVAIVLAFVRMKVQRKREATTSYVSIAPSRRDHQG